MKKLFALSVLFVYSIIAIGENVENENNGLKANNISIGLVGLPTYPIGLSFSQMLTDKLSFEIGAGFAAAGAGFTYYFTNPGYHRFNPYAGFYGGIEFSGFSMFYVPVGISYFGKKNFQYSVDIGPIFSDGLVVTEGDSNPSFYFGLKAGYRFGQTVEVLNNSEKTGKKNIVSLNGSNSGIYLGLIYERLLTPFLSVEAGLGLFGISAGAKVYFPSIRPGALRFHAGVTESFGGDLWNGVEPRTYIPFGVNILTKGNLWFSGDLGPQIWTQGENYIDTGFSLRIGRAF